MTIRNGQGIRSIEDLQRPLDGSPTPSSRARGRANPLAPQVTLVTFAGTETDGLYSASWTDIAGNTLTASVTRVGGTPATHADLAVAFADDLNGQDAWRNVATAAPAGDTAVLTFLHAGQVWASTATAAPAPGTIAVANSSNAGGAAVPVGRLLIAVANLQDPDVPAHGLPLPGSTAAQIIGFSARDGSVENSGSPDPAVVESIPAGRMISSGYEGAWFVTNVGTVASTEHGDVFGVVNPAGGQLAGQVRADADGGNTVQLTQARAYWLDSGVQPGERGRIFLRF